MLITCQVAIIEIEIEYWEWVTIIYNISKSISKHYRTPNTPTILRRY